MPLRDHFRPPVENEHSWDELHGIWPAVIVQQLFPLLPDGYITAPRVHLGAPFKIDVSTFEQDEPATKDRVSDGSAGVAVATWAPPKPTFTLEILCTQNKITLVDRGGGRLLGRTDSSLTSHLGNKDDDGCILWLAAPDLSH